MKCVNIFFDKNNFIIFSTNFSVFFFFFFKMSAYGSINSTKRPTLKYLPIEFKRNEPIGNVVLNYAEDW